jgi:L-ascorbate metabolism protein UlaG (beta-lactamase superfamily)
MEEFHMTTSMLARFTAAAVLALASAAALATTQLTWYGHAAFKITTPSGKVILLDPWIKNPANKNGETDLAQMDKVDLILVTHGHGDHIGDAVAIAQKTGAQLVATFDLGKAIVQYQGYPEKQFDRAATGNFGGEIPLLDGEVKVAFIPAVHSSSVAAAVGKDVYAGGNPGGFLVTVKDGPSFYHTGDTDLFSDMALISKFRPVDVMMTAIGDKFTMGPARAAAAVDLVKPLKMVIPMHFGTYPVLVGNPADFSAVLKKLDIKTPMRPMAVGESIRF